MRALPANTSGSIALHTPQARAFRFEKREALHGLAGMVKHENLPLSMCVVLFSAFHQRVCPDFGTVERST